MKYKIQIYFHIYSGERVVMGVCRRPQRRVTVRRRATIPAGNSHYPTFLRIFLDIHFYRACARAGGGYILYLDICSHWGFYTVYTFFRVFYTYIFGHLFVSGFYTNNIINTNVTPCQSEATIPAGNDQQFVGILQAEIC